MTTQNYAQDISEQVYDALVEIITESFSGSGLSDAKIESIAQDYAESASEKTKQIFIEHAEVKA